MRPYQIKQSLKDWCVEHGRRVTLNGEDAAVRGRLEDCATIVAIRVDGPRVDYAWEQAEQIILKGGQFRT